MTAQVIQFRRMADLPNRIRELRKARNWTLEQLGERIHCGTTMASDLERGNRELTYHWMKTIARAFGVEPADLLLPTDNSKSLAADEHELVGLYQRATPEQRLQLMQMARIVVAPTKSTKAA